MIKTQYPRPQCIVKYEIPSLGLKEEPQISGFPEQEAKKEEVSNLSLFTNSKFA